MTEAKVTAGATATSTAIEPLSGELLLTRLAATTLDAHAMGNA